MALRRIAEKRITREEYVRAAQEAGMTSWGDSPQDPYFVRYRCDASEFLELEVFPVWFTDPGRGAPRNYSDPDATPLTYRELRAIPWLRDEKLAAAPPDGAVVAQLTVEHCTGCGRYLVKDGCKRLLRIACEGRRMDLEVTQVEGRERYCQMLWTET